LKAWSAKRKRDSAQHKLAKRKRDSAQHKFMTARFSRNLKNARGHKRLA
jgi:hypothetical protein